CHDFNRSTLQNSAWRRRATAQPSASTACIHRPRTLSTCTLSERWSFPVRNGKTLRAFFSAGLLGFLKLQKTRCTACIAMDLESVVVLPGDVQPSRLTHDAADAERLTLKSCLIVLLQIPRVSRPNSFGIQRKTFEVTLARCRHAMPPIFTHDGDPIAGQIDWSDRFGGLRRPTLSSLCL